MTIYTLTNQMDNKEDEMMDNESSESDNETDDNDDVNENAGWADSIAKILKTKKPKGKKTLILSKGRKLADVVIKKSNNLEFEVQTASGKIKQELDVKLDDSKEEEPSNKLHECRKKKDLPVFRKKPDILKKDRERTLCKIATKGVVQLFNAIRSQQIDTNKKLQEAGSMEIKRNKVLKNVNKKAFLDKLMSEQSETVSAKENISIKDSTKVGKSWNILRDDFMIGAKLKDWDKELEKEEEIEYE